MTGGQDEAQAWIDQENDARRMLVVGPAGSGKDTVCDELAKVTGRPRMLSTSAWYTMEYYSATLESFRQLYPATWRQRLASGIAEYNALDHSGCRLYWRMFQEGNVLNGVRRWIELSRCVRLLNVKTVIWVERPVPADATLDFEWDDLAWLGRNVRDVTVYNLDNTGPLEHLRRNVLAMCRELAIPLLPDWEVL